MQIRRVAKQTDVISNEYIPGLVQPQNQSTPQPEIISHDHLTPNQRLLLHHSTEMRFTRSVCCLAATATTAAAQAAYPAPADGKTPTEFTSMFEITATPDQVVNANNTLTGGLAGAQGLYRFSLNSKDNIICYNITLTGFRGDYSSPASTATHIHEAVVGKSGPPRIAFPNPVEVYPGTNVRQSVGCIQGTQDGFVTGLKNSTTGQDQGYGFTVKRIEDNPSWFFADVHSSEAVPGAVRGQFSAPVAPLPSASVTGSTSPPASSSAVPMTTRVYPANCTAACTTITEPCPDATVAPPAPYGTGSWTAPPAPPATGGSVAPPPASTWVKPTAPSATPTSIPSASASVTPYEGAAAERLVSGGMILALMGLLQIVV